MPPLPVVSGAEAVRRFCAMGYVVVRQRGSHARLHHRTDHTRHPLAIPLHRHALGPGLLRSLIRQAGISVEEFARL